MYSEESQKQAALSGVSVQVGQRKREGELASTWRVERTAVGGTVETTFEFMHWDDITRRHWHAGYTRLYGLAFKTYWYWIIASDFLAKVFRIAKWTFVTVIAPAVALFVLPALAVLAGWAGYSFVQSASPETGWLPALSGEAGFAAVIALGWWLERRLSLGWLLRTYAFVLEYSLGKVPKLDERLDRFAERIAGYVEAADDDEILVVGHSLGANVAVSVLARALAINPLLFRQYKPVGLLTLGGSIPLQGLLPWARLFRDELALLAANGDLTWVDISAPQDVASFALLNPVMASGVAVDEKASQRPQVVSARFRELLSPETYDTAKWNLFRMHFQYLMTSEREAVHDYLSVTTDSLRFRDRFGENPKTADGRQ
jgi:pimeloyl-ACP methyl ester carboxylesterase